MRTLAVPLTLMLTIIIKTKKETNIFIYIYDKYNYNIKQPKKLTKTLVRHGILKLSKTKRFLDFNIPLSSFLLL